MVNFAEMLGIECMTIDDNTQLGDIIGVCMENEPRPTSGRPEKGPNQSIGRFILQANVDKSLLRWNQACYGP
jgi:hypothetical protein